MNLTRIIKNIIWRIFPPESWTEVFLRTIYHHLVSTNFYTAWQIEKSKRSYRGWINRQNNFLTKMHSTTLYIPSVTFIIQITLGNFDSVIRTITSLKEQQTNGWQVLVTYSEDLTTNEHFLALMDSFQINICRQQIPNLKSLISLCESDYVIISIAGDEFSPSFLKMFGQIHSESPNAAVFFPDIVLYGRHDHEPKPFFKPERYSPELLLTVNYLSRSLIKKSCAESVIDKIDPSFSFFNQEWNLLILICQKFNSIVHIPYLLVHEVEINELDYDDVSNQLFTRYSNSKYILQSLTQGNKGNIITSTPKVSIIIPTINNFQAIKTLLDSIYTQTEYQNFEIILVDNRSTDNKVISYYKELSLKNDLRIVNYDEKFNYSRAVNLGVSSSEGELILILNNDMKVLTHTWLFELVKWAIIPEVGVVGTKLLRPNNTIQHAGIVIGLEGFIGHIYLNMPDHYYGLAGSVDWTRNVCAVTGACQMIRRNVYYELGGYDEKFQLVFSDVDFCLRMINHGYRVVYAPSAAMIHYEGKSRGFKTPINDILRGYEKMGDYLEKEDPYFSPNLTYTSLPKCQFQGNSTNNRLAYIEKRKKDFKRRLRNWS